jgi:hypothetical protein
MGAPDLLQQLRAAGFVLSATDAGGITIAPASALKDEHRQAIRANRGALLLLLRGADSATARDDGGYAGQWDETTIARFTDRRDRLMRWGYSEAEAERLAERLAIRDFDGDDRGMCVECRFLERGGRCAEARAGRLVGFDGRYEPARTVLHRCESYEPVCDLFKQGESK